MTTVIRQDIEGDIVVWTMDHPTKSTNTIDQAFLAIGGTCPAVPIGWSGLPPSAARCERQSKPHVKRGST